MAYFNDAHGNVPVTHWDCGDDSEAPLKVEDIELVTVPDLEMSTWHQTGPFEGHYEPGSTPSALHGPRVRFP